MPQKPSQKSLDLNRPQPTSPGPLHLPFKIKDLGLLTYISRKSVSRRFSRCNSQLLTPSGRRAMKETMFIPSRATRGENRLRSILALRGDCLSSSNHQNVTTPCERKTAPNS